MNILIVVVAFLLFLTPEIIDEVYYHWISPRTKVRYGCKWRRRWIPVEERRKRRRINWLLFKRRIKRILT